MNNLKKLLAVILALVMMASVLSACGGEETTGSENQGQSGTNNEQSGNNGNGTTTEVPVGQTGVGATGVGNYGGHMTMRIAATPNGLDPLKQTGTWKYFYTTCVFDTALTRDAENNIVPGICDFELSEDMLDLKMWVRDGYIFSNGDPVDIYDVEASWNRALNLYSNIKKYVKPNVASMTVENDGEKDILHVVFSKYHEKNLYYMAAYRTWNAIMPKEICEKYSNGYIVDQIEDAIGTGPYKYTDYVDSQTITVSKRYDYVPVDNSAHTGFGGTKYGYLDSITFRGGMNDAAAAVALLAKDIDMVEVIPSEYTAMCEAEGINLEVLRSDQGTAINFNSKGETNLCSMYPSLRKAILAAIDYPSFLAVLTDNSAVELYSDANCFILNDLYATEAWREQDFYGEAQQAVVDKYLEAARAEGYKGEPIQVVYSNSRTDIPTLMCDALENFGINYKLTTMENSTYTAFIGSYSNNWDFYFGWVTSAYTPATLGDSVLINSFTSERRDEIVEEMCSVLPTSDRYLELWNELAHLLADNAYFGYMARIDWWWWHPNTLHSNDEGCTRYVFNTYWDDPQNHPAPSGTHIEH